MSSRRHAGRWFAVAAMVALLLAGCAPKQPDPNLLVVYSAGPRPLAEAIAEAFTEVTGIEVNLFAATTGQIMAKLEAERYRPRADVVVFASRFAAESMRETERLLPYPDPEWLGDTRTDWHDPEGYFHSTSAALVGMAFREDAMKVDADWTDMLHGEFSGRMTMPSPSRSGATGDFIVGYTMTRDDEAWRDYHAARQAGLEFSAANSQAIGGLLIGAYHVILGAVDYLIYRQIDQGAPLIMHYPPSGSMLVQRPIGILRDTRVPDSARRFVDFYFSAQAQSLIADSHLLPARHDIALSATRSESGMTLPPVLKVDAREGLKRQTRILRRFQLEIERAEVIRGVP